MRLKSDNADIQAGIKIVSKALESPIRQIAENAGVEGSIVVGKVLEKSGNFGFDAQKEDYVDMVSAGIIDPTKVVRIALQDAASVASLLITTEAMIAERPKESAPPADAPGRRHGRDGLLNLPFRTERAAFGPPFLFATEPAAAYCLGPIAYCLFARLTAGHRREQRQLADAGKRMVERHVLLVGGGTDHPRIGEGEAAALIAVREPSDQIADRQHMGRDGDLLLGAAHPFADPGEIQKFHLFSSIRCATPTRK